MVRGERAAMDSWDGLLALKRKLGLAEDYQPRRPGPFRLPGAAVDREIPVDSQIAAPAVRLPRRAVRLASDSRCRPK